MTYPKTRISERNGYGTLAIRYVHNIGPLTLKQLQKKLAQYHSLLGLDENLAGLVKAIINTEARYISQYPYCGAFQPPPESGLAPSHNDYADGVTVFP